MDSWTSFVREMAQMVMAFAALVTAIVTLRKTYQVSENVQKVEVLANSSQTELMRLSKVEGVAQGKLEERANPTPKNPHLGGG